MTIFFVYFRLVRRLNKYKNLSPEVKHRKTPCAEGSTFNPITADIRLLSSVTLLAGKCDNSTQVDFLDKEEQEPHAFMMSAEYKMGDTSEAATQTCIPISADIKRKRKIIQKETSIDKGINTDFFSGWYGPEKSIQSKQTEFRGRESITDNQDMLDLAGVSLDAFNLLLEKMENSDGAKISKENRLLIFLFKMKLGIPFGAIGILFGVHRTSISRIFYETLDNLAQACKNFVFWPSRATVDNRMPEEFKEFYKNCRCIIDCTEIKIDAPSNVSQANYYWSHYKKSPTLKFLVACSPDGLITFVSETFGGRTTDVQITNQSGLLDLLQPGDLILADKGFPEIQTKLDEEGNGIVIVMPPFLHNKTFTANEVRETKKVASVRIHIERIMQRIKIYRILAKLPRVMMQHADDIVFMCCALVNLQPPIIRQTHSE